jgi:hypothetical protein
MRKSSAAKDIIDFLVQHMHMREFTYAHTPWQAQSVFNSPTHYPNPPINTY